VSSVPRAAEGEGVYREKGVSRVHSKTFFSIIHQLPQPKSSWLNTTF
jgi:hypothetical protein